MSDRLTAAGVDDLMEAMKMREAFIADMSDLARFDALPPDRASHIRERLDAYTRALIAAMKPSTAARAVDEALSVERVAEALNRIDYRMVDRWVAGDEPPTDIAAALVAHLRGEK